MTPKNLQYLLSALSLSLTLAMGLSANADSLTLVIGILAAQAIALSLLLWWALPRWMAQAGALPLWRVQVFYAVLVTFIGLAILTRNANLLTLSAVMSAVFFIFKNQVD